MRDRMANPPPPSLAERILVPMLAFAVTAALLVPPLMSLLDWLF
jgi:hypothetical protein